MKRRGTKVTVAAVAALALAGGGAAVAATQFSPQEESDAVVSDAAKQLGVTPEELSGALKGALANRVDAAVEAGRITEEQGRALKERIEAGEVPLIAPRAFGPGHGPHGHHGGPLGRGLDAAAAYLGVAEDALRDRLRAGESLADVARAEGKPVDGLVTALLDAAEERLDAAVDAGRITEAQKAERLADLRTRVEALVERSFEPGEHRRFRDGPPPAEEEDGDAEGASFAA